MFKELHAALDCDQRIALNEQYCAVLENIHSQHPSSAQPICWDEEVSVVVFLVEAVAVCRAHPAIEVKEHDTMAIGADQRADVVC